MTRKALIIGNNTGYQAPKYLYGVNHDLSNIDQYLQSDVGGNWISGGIYNEIHILHNQKRSTILNVINNCNADYTFILYSGHGFYNSDDNLTYICVEGNFISENELNTGCSKQTLILDCCREVESISKSHAATGDILTDSLNYFSQSRKITNARQKFDSALSQSSVGQFRGYACLVNQTSGDNPNSGGVFTSALLKTGYAFGSIDNNTGIWLPIKDAFDVSISEIRQNLFTKQIPTYEMIPSTMKLTHPFAITNLSNRLW